MKAFLIVISLSLFGTALSQVPICQFDEVKTYPYVTDCTKYYECNHGVLTIQNCPPGLYYNDTLQSCDFSSVTRCDQIVCPSYAVDYFPYPNNCTLYVECFHGIITVNECPDPYWFNQYQKQCVPDYQSECGEYASTVVPTWTTPISDYCLYNPPNNIVIYPHPYDCKLYIVCNGAEETIYACPPGFLYDENRHMCNFPELVDCDGTTPFTTPPTPSTIDPRCGSGDGYYAVPDCTKFLQCSNGYAYEQSCPAGLNFDIVSSSCQDPSVAQCGFTTTPPPTTPTTPNTSPNPSCVSVPNGTTFPYPGYCFLYFVCVSGNLIVQECPPNLWYNKHTGLCDYPYQADCDWGL